jgi:hypothetical protein
MKLQRIIESYLRLNLDVINRSNREETMTEIPYVSEELMKKVEAIFYHGPKRAKNHDQRFGQYLINKIRTSEKYSKGYNKACKSGHEKEFIEMVLWNIENPDLLELIKDYNN